MRELDTDEKTQLERPYRPIPLRPERASIEPKPCDAARAFPAVVALLNAEKR